MPLTDELKGTNADGSQETNVPIPRLKRWKEADQRTMPEKAAALLAQCENVTLASVDADGFPRPVPLSKLQTKGFHDIWMTTAADSVKVADFRQNCKAGLCYDYYGNSVALRGTVEVVDDEATRRAMWQEEFIHHFPGGPTDPNYVLLHFVGSEATFWINNEFAHEPIK